MSTERNYVIEAKYRYYIITLDGVTGTNDSKLARQIVADDEYAVVIDVHDNTVMMPPREDGGDAVGETIPEAR